MKSLRTLVRNPRPMARLAKTIGTHDGTFHCDEVLGCWMLKRLPRFSDAVIKRTRDKEVLNQIDLVLDVGGVYDPSKCRFDHHQRGFSEVFGNGHSIKLSSAGLIYKHYGMEILKHVIAPIQLSEEDLTTVYLKVYKGFIKAIDGIDNGVMECGPECQPQYINSTTVTFRINRLNPTWNEVDPDITSDGQFQKAMTVCGSEFTEFVLFSTKTWLPARIHVQKAFAERQSVSETGEIIHLEVYCPWQEHLLDLEAEQGLTGSIKYCIYKDSGGAYRVQAVPMELHSFESRLPLPEAWRALRNEELDKESGIEGCVFVHANGFIGGNSTKEGVLEMAEKSIELAKSKPLAPFGMPRVTHVYY